MTLRLIAAGLAWLALPLAACGQDLPVTWRADAVATYPHDRDAFTQGLFIHEGALYESTGRVGQSSLRRVALDSGQVERLTSIGAPYFGEGATRLGDRIYMVTWVMEQGFIFDAESFEEIGRFTYEGEGWGLTHDGDHLILSDGSATLRYLDPESLAVTATLDVTLNGRPVRRLNELEWVDGEIWANVWGTHSIVRINPQSGAVTGLVDLSALIPAGLERSREAVANGIAWNAQTGQIYVTGKLWPALYEIRLVDPANGG